MKIRRILTTSVLLASVGCGGGGDGDAEFVDRMGQEHAGDEPVASPAADADVAAPVDTTEVTYATVDGNEITGFLAKPQGGDGGPAMIVIHEWWGLNDNIRSMARQFAGQGYTALAVDLYGGRSAETRDEAMALMQGAMEAPAPLDENLRQAFAYLKTEHGATKVGSVGWCFGGGWSLRAALLLPGELDATVIYYGRLVTDREQLAALSTPILGLFGGEDQGIPVDSVREFEGTLSELGKQVTVHVYDGAGHAFANPSGTRYNAEAAEDAWAKTLAFLREHLQG